MSADSSRRVRSNVSVSGRLKEEAPYAYKPIAPVIETVAAAGIARSVARLEPLLTIKG